MRDWEWALEWCLPIKGARSPMSEATQKSGSHGEDSPRRRWSEAQRRRIVAESYESASALANKRVTPHVLRHATAMSVLHASRGDPRKVSLWLGHADVRTTEDYLRACPAEKMEILEAHAPPSIRRGNFKGVKDSLMTVLEGK